LRIRVRREKETSPPRMKTGEHRVITRVIEGVVGEMILLHHVTAWFVERNMNRDVSSHLGLRKELRAKSKAQKEKAKQLKKKAEDDKKNK